MKTIIVILSALIGFAVGLGVSYWNRLEDVSVFFVSGIEILVLIGLLIFGVEFWLHFRAFRQANARFLAKTLPSSKQTLALSGPNAQSSKSMFWKLMDDAFEWFFFRIPE